MARVARVEVVKRRSGWAWYPTDPQGRVRLEGGRSGYSRKASAVRGARRACGASVKVDVKG